MLGLLVAIPLSLLPQRYRGRWHAHGSLTTGALVSGVVECIVCVALLGWGYIRFLDANVKAMAGEVIKRGADEALGSVHIQAGMGILSLMQYLLQPLSLLLVYFAFEGLIRFSAAVISSEAVPTLPLQLMAWGHGSAQRRAVERELGPLIPDQVERITDKQKDKDKDCDLRILTCRLRPNWNHLMTISYEDELYEIVRQEQGTRPRQFRYLLRRKPEGKVVRGLHQYSPDELLPPPK